jgi:hypothetical protein
MHHVGVGSRPPKPTGPPIKPRFKARACCSSDCAADLRAPTRTAQTSPPDGLAFRARRARGPGFGLRAHTNTRLHSLSAVIVIPVRRVIEVACCRALNLGGIFIRCVSPALRCNPEFRPRLARALHWSASPRLSLACRLSAIERAWMGAGLSAQLGAVCPNGRTPAHLPARQLSSAALIRTRSARALACGGPAECRVHSPPPRVALTHEGSASLLIPRRLRAHSQTAPKHAGR